MGKSSNNLKPEKILSKVAHSMATVAANSRCAYCFHQPKLPTDVKKLRKF